MSNNKKVIVTGSSGFIGSHVADALEEHGYRVILFDSVPSKYKTGDQEEFIGDILDLDKITTAMKGCDTVCHFAAQADINLSSDSPSETITTNIIGTQNVLEAARKHKVKRFLFASTIYVYSELGSFYRVSKQACEKIIQEYQKEFDLDYTILRFGSLYGQRANKFNAINDFLTQALKNKIIVRRGNGEEIREYIHVKDAARLSVQALEGKYKNQYLIITGNQKIKVKKLLKMIQKIFKGEIEIQYGSEEPLHHYVITPYTYNPQVAKKLSPKTYYDLEQGILDLIYDIKDGINKNIEFDKIGLLENNK